MQMRVRKRTYGHEPIRARYRFMIRPKEDEPTAVTFIGALPPPVTGMTAMTQVIVEALCQGGPVRCFNWSRGRHLSGLKWKMARVSGACLSFVKIILGRRRPREVVYYPVSSGWGLLYDIAILGAARLRGYRVFVHHHVYSYINRRDWRMVFLTRMLGPDSVHVVHCEQMKHDFLNQYSTNAKFLFVPPTIVASDAYPLTTPPHERFTLGLLSNLSLAKGLDSAIDTYTALANAGRNVALILAGPCQGSTERRLIDHVVSKWPDRVEYRGPVYNAAKDRFFADIDVFLFPTRYNNESWGIVLNEALAASRPVISGRRGCVPWIVQDGCGIVVDDPRDFVPQACRSIIRWMDDEQEFARIRERAGCRAKSLTQEAERQFAYFLSRIRSL